MTTLGGILLVLTLLLSAGLDATVATLRSSDPAGNGLAYVAAVFMTIAIWVLLAALLLLAGTKGEMPGWARVAALVLHPATGVATMVAIHLLSRSGALHVKWLLIVPAAAPLLMAGYAVWVWHPGVHAMLSARTAGQLAWGGCLFLALAPYPVSVIERRERAIERAAARAAAESQPR